MTANKTFVKAYSAPQLKTKHEIMKAEKNAMISIAKEEEKKFAKMDLADLKEMACIKATQHNKDWYMTCVSCPGENGCSIGRRVIEILESETKPEERKTQIQKFNERESKSDKEQFIEALKHKDIYDYIVKTYKISRSGAYNKVYRWKIKYPDVKCREFDPQLSNKERIEKTRATVVEAFTYPDGVFAYFINVLKVSDRSIIRGRVINWANTYKDLNEQYHISEWVESTKGKPGRKPKNAEPESLVNEEPKAKTVITRTEDDEVSISDFLNEMEEKPVVSATVMNPVPAANVKDALENIETIDIASMHPISAISENIVRNASFHEDIQKQEQKNSVCSALSEKRKQICQRIDNLYEMIKQYNDEITEWKKKLEAFDTVAIEMGFSKEF